MTELYKLMSRMVFLSFFFGFLALSIEGGLAFVIALGKVHQDTSYGLLNVLGSLNTALGAFVGFAFGAMMWNFVLRSWNTPIIEPEKVQPKPEITS